MHLMKISDSLKEDIADAPNWFHQAIETKLEQKNMLLMVMRLPIRNGILMMKNS